MKERKAVRIRLTNGRYTIVDAEDAEWVKKYVWHEALGYATRRIRVSKLPEHKFKTIHLHREVNKTPDGLFTDHINLNRLDNRKANLRTVTLRQNSWNRKKSKKNTSGILGVRFRPDLGINKVGKWTATISSHYIGSYYTRREAIAARQAAVKAALDKEYENLQTIPSATLGA